MAKRATETRATATSSAADEIKKAIAGKEAELDACAKERQAAEAAGDALKLVEAEKRERTAAAQLDALKEAYRAATYKPPEPTDREELLKPLQKYMDEYNARLQKISDSMAEIDRAAAEIEKGLRDAAEKADTQATAILSAQRMENNALKKHMAELMDRAKALPVYPAGAIGNEWAAICERLKPEWDNCTLQIATLAAAYKAAAEALLTLHSTLLDARGEYEQRQGGKPLPTFFTTGGNADGMTIEKTYLARLKTMYSPITGRSL